MLKRLPEGSLLVADRNFGIFAFAHAAVTAGHGVLLRLTRKRFAALLRQAQPAGPRYRRYEPEAQMTNS